MFAPPVSEQETKATVSPTRQLAAEFSTFVGPPTGGTAVERAHLLQRSIGNQATLRLMAGSTTNPAGNEGHPVPRIPPGVIQPKLAVGPVDDPAENEADRVADDVMRMPDLQASCTAAPPRINRKCDACEEEEKKKLQTKTADTTRAAGEAPPIVHEVLDSPGEPLDAGTRAFFEPRFGRDFSQVRVHADAKATESARSVNALAYTYGQDVVFAGTRFAPQTTEGKRLLAHELTHVVQQGQTSAPSDQASSTLQRQPATPQGRVTSIDPVTGPSQNALTTFPALPVPDCDLNAPGPANNTNTGTCRNIHQVHFHLAGITAGDVRLLRIVERTTVAGGKTETIEKSDGPSDPTVIRPNDHLIAVGDCPGFEPGAASPGSVNPTAFPISYHAHFILSAHDTLAQMAALAKISYDVAIDKKAIDDPSPTNTFNVTDTQIF